MEYSTSDHEELLLPLVGVVPTDVKKTNYLFACSLKGVLKIATWFALFAWFVILVLFPTDFMSDLMIEWTRICNQSFVGNTGGAFLIISGPLIAAALLSTAYLALNSYEVEHSADEDKAKRARYKLWTMPVMVEGPLGVATAAELIGIIIMMIYAIWSFGIYDFQKISALLHTADYTTETDKWIKIFKLVGCGFGLAGLLCLAFLFIPVARGSVILRFVNTPSHQAIRYHSWTGNVCMLLFTLHGLCFIIAWSISGQLLSQLLSWYSSSNSTGSNFAGVILMCIGWFMWITSLPFVRQKNFELFYYTHQMYIFFVVFLAMHIGNFLFCVVAGGIFVFMIDRFLRFCQSRNNVDIISMVTLPGGVVELVLSKPPNLQYNALSIFFVRVREMSRLQWHPFSVASSPLDGRYLVSVLIKSVGNWTSNLRNNVQNISEKFQEQEELSSYRNQITASVEGPYGYELPCHLMKENLILVAGGIGISPFIAMLRDILHRIREGKKCPPRKIFLAWCVKRSHDISFLSNIYVESISSFPSDQLQIELRIHVTQETEPPLENGVFDKGIGSSIRTKSNGNAISGLVVTGNKIWSGVYIFSCSIAMLLFICLLNIFSISTYPMYKALLLLACMVTSIVVIGGTIVGLWHFWEERILAKERNSIDKETTDTLWKNEQTQDKNMFLDSLASSTTIRYGSRPDFKELFGSISTLWGHVNVAVIVCGPPTLQSSVARECRRRNIKRPHKDPIFHFISHSFCL